MLPDDTRRTSPDHGLPWNGRRNLTAILGKTRPQCDVVLRLSFATPAVFPDWNYTFDSTPIEIWLSL
jgi:hypothetical protein